MNRLYRDILLLMGAALSSSSHSFVAVAEAGMPHLGTSQEAGVQFDLPPVAPAVAAGNDPTEVTVELRLSSMIDSTGPALINQWLVECEPRDRSIWIADYAPRTETDSEVATPIQIKNTTEKVKGMGIGLDGAYGHLARINTSADQSQKQISSVQFDRVAPVQAVTASGTINRGRGVYFKLRWTAQQVLEGEKTFRLTLKVPKQWRGSLIDVSVIAQGERKSFGWDRETKTIGSANFVVAVYRDQDVEAESIARSLAESEFALRTLAAKYRAAEAESHSLPSVLRHVANKFDIDSDRRDDQDWLQRLLTNRADPHLDKQIRRLPMPIRVAILDYADHRKAFLTIDGDSTAAAIESIADNKSASSTRP